MYIELDHGLVAGKVKDINKKTVLEGRKEEREDRPFGATKYLLNKYNISKQPVKDVLLKKGSPTEKTSSPAESRKTWWRNLKTEKKKEKQVKKEEEFVIGSDGEVFFDHDFGFFGAILAC